MKVIMEKYKCIVPVAYKFPLPDQVQECDVLQLESDLKALLAQIFNRQKTMAAFRPTVFLWSPR